MTISRPQKLNSVNTHLLTLLPKTLSEITAQNKDLIAIVLTGDGSKSFVGGADIAEMGSLTTPAAARAFITRIHLACKSIRECPIPVIGRINGFALGGGLEIAAACDFRVASKNAVFGMPEVKVGVPSVVEAALFPGLIGWGRTRRLLILGENIDAHEAEKWGLVEKVVDDQTKLDEAVEEWIEKLEECGPGAVKGQKELMRRWEMMGIDAGIEAGIEHFGRSWEADEGTDALSEPQRMMGDFLRKQAERKGASKL